MSEKNGVSTEERLRRLEDEVRHLKELFAEHTDEPWWKKVAGTFKDDPVFAEITRLGAEIRKKDLVPVWVKRKSKRKARKRVAEKAAPKR